MESELTLEKANKTIRQKEVVVQEQGKELECEMKKIESLEELEIKTLQSYKHPWTNSGETRERSQRWTSMAAQGGAGWLKTSKLATCTCCGYG